MLFCDGVGESFLCLLCLTLLMLHYAIMHAFFPFSCARGWNPRLQAEPTHIAFYSSASEIRKLIMHKPIQGMNERSELIVVKKQIKVNLVQHAPWQDYQI